MRSVRGHDEDGQTLTEYALVLALILAIAVLLGPTLVTAVGDLFETLVDLF